MPSFDPNLAPEPSLDDKPTFGKYKGQATWLELLESDPMYVLWVTECVDEISEELLWLLEDEVGNYLPEV